MKRVFAISDIHGCYDTFYELVVRKLDLKKSDRLVLLGDYIDRGPKSREVVEFITDLIAAGFDVIPLTGNHEVMLVDAYNDPELLPLWYLNSGMTTLASFNISEIRDLDKHWLRFFSGLGYFYPEGNFLFVHAGFNDDLEDPFSDSHHMIWECRPSYYNEVFSGKTIIHGHRPKRPDYVRKQISSNSLVIPIDTGCVYEREMGFGFLSALEVNTMELISIPRGQ